MPIVERTAYCRGFIGMEQKDKALGRVPAAGRSMVLEKAAFLDPGSVFRFLSCGT